MRKMRRIAATALVAAMALSTTVSAAEWNTDGGEAIVTGDSTVTQPVIEVALPGDLAFVIDPYMVEYDNQITGFDYNVVNYSNVDVTVGVNPSIVEFMSEDDTPVSLTMVDPVTTAPALNADGLSYTDLTPSTATNANIEGTPTKKAVYLTAIPADPVAALTDSDADGIYEFAYTADATNVGRAANVYTPATDTDPELYTYGAATAGAATGLAYPLSLKQIGVKDATPTFTYVLGKEAGVTDPDTEIYTPAVTSVGSFTVNGTVDAKAGITDGEVQIQAVYTLATLSVNEKATLDATGMNADKQQLKAVVTTP